MHSLHTATTCASLKAHQQQNLCECFDLEHTNGIAYDRATNRSIQCCPAVAAGNDTNHTCRTESTETSAEAMYNVTLCIFNVHFASTGNALPTWEHKPKLSRMLDDTCSPESREFVMTDGAPIQD
jgi:hypothetical protein